MVDIDVLERDLAETHSGEWPLLTVSVDLTPGPEGIPAASQIVKQGWRAAEEVYTGDLTSRDALRSYEHDQRSAEQLQDEAIRRGFRGLFYAGCAATDLQVVLETPYPMRNSVHLGNRPWLFELMRYRYLVHRPAILAVVELSGIRIIRIAYGDVEEEFEVRRWEGPVTGPHGRTDTQGVGSFGADVGGGAATPAAQGGQRIASDVTGGWHGKTRIEKSILAHKEAFGKEDAASLADLVQADDLVVLAGPDEARAELRPWLPPGLQDVLVEAPNVDPTLSDAELADIMTEFVVEEQYRRAELELRRWESGDLGAKAIGGVEGIADAISRGQLETLILPEDVVPHLGSAADARARPGSADAEAVDGLLHGALGVSARCLFTREPPRSAGGAPAGILRWI